MVKTKLQKRFSTSLKQLLRRLNLCWFTLLEVKAEQLLF